MTAPSSTVLALATLIDMLRDGTADREQQKAAFRALYALVEPSGVTLSTDVRGVLIGGLPLPDGIPGGETVRACFSAHGVGSVRVPPGARPADLLAVVRQLAEDGEAGATVEAFVTRLPVEAALAIRVEGHSALPQAGDIRTLDDLSTPIGSTAPTASNQTTVGGTREPGSDLVQRGQAAFDSLRDIEVQADLAFRREDWDELLKLATEVHWLETAEQDEGTRRRYATTLRRILPKSTLQHLARAALAGGKRVEATAVLRRMGADAVEALLELLTAAPTLEERRGYFAVLTRMEEGTDQIVAKLNHPDWFVVRNVAELCGELGLPTAARPLGEQAHHRDERVRRAVAAALGKIEAPEGLEALRRLLNDVVPAVRLQAAGAIRGPWAKALVPSLAVRLPEEPQADVLHEMHLALGRVGTSEAVELLRNAAAPAKGFLARKPLATRLAAIEGLGLAVGPAAAGALQDLLGDADQEVRAAAECALTGGERRA